jgi:UDP-N-acetylglucosamine--dolichyl-phosphate N-acetylglucosaminephosphotransferase
MAILGIADDIFDIRWRHKVFLPAIASIPLLMVYYVDFNVTVVVTPKPLIRYLPHLIDLGLYLDSQWTNSKDGSIMDTWHF